MNVHDLITTLQLRPHPEGGYYKETYRSAQAIENADGHSRNLSTAIYYLLEDDQKSLFHRISSDELWFFHQGAPLEITYIEQEQVKTIILGNNLHQGEVPQATIPGHTWFAAKIQNHKGYALVSCTVAPGFDFADFELAKRQDLLAAYPHFEDIICTFTK